MTGMRRSEGVRAALLGLAIGLVATEATGRSLFEGNFNVDGQTATATSSDLTDFADFFTDEGLNRLFGNYTPTSSAVASVSLRGVPATLSYAQNSTVLVLQIPSIGVNESFNGATRDESQDLALQWLRGDGQGALTRFLKEAVATTPIDPIAGNPNSLMSLMGAADFNAALGGTGAGGAFGAQQDGGRFSLGARFGSYSASGWNTDVYTLPIAYTYGLQSGVELILDAPITLLDTAGGQSYSGSVGIGARIPLRLGLPDWMRWSLTPMLRTGVAGSIDLGAAGGIWSLSVTSNLDFRLGERWSLTVGNMASRLETLPISYQDYSVSYELQNYMFRNGLVVHRDLGEVFGRRATLSGFAVDTRFTGDALYVNNYQEYGVFLGLGDPVQVGGFRLPIRLGATYLNGQNGYEGFTVNLGISF
jgi:hypothetical protein